MVLKNLNGCHIEIKKWYYEFPESLRYLDISGCKLSRIGMPNLKKFNCDNYTVFG